MAVAFGVPVSRIKLRLWNDKADRKLEKYQRYSDDDRQHDGRERELPPQGHTWWWQRFGPWRAAVDQWDRPHPSADRGKKPRWPPPALPRLASSARRPFASCDMIHDSGSPLRPRQGIGTRRSGPSGPA